MSVSFTNLRTIILGGCILLSLFSCKKLELLTGNKTALEQYFSDNVLNRDFIVDFASDNGTDITSQYQGYNFVLTRGDSVYGGKLTGVKNGVTYYGTWSTTDDFSKLVIELSKPTVPAAFIFLNRTWKFTKKTPPVLQLAPYGTLEDKVLYMRRL